MNRSRNLLLPPIVLERRSVVPIHRQLRNQLAAAIGTSPAGTCLPSTRTLARILGVSRNTVLAVYDDLAADGLIQGRRGAAMVVASGAAAPVFSPAQLLREAGYPTRTLEVADLDGNPLCLSH